MVALLAEGVDRNLYCGCHCLDLQRSPSSRRAWIEMVEVFEVFQASHVALLAEGVDRNFSVSVVFSDRMVALLAEGVDRNFFCAKQYRQPCGRPPRGGRG